MTRWFVIIQGGSLDPGFPGENVIRGCSYINIFKLSSSRHKLVCQGVDLAKKALLKWYSFRSLCIVFFFGGFLNN